MTGKHGASGNGSLEEPTPSGREIQDEEGLPPMIDSVQSGVVGM